VFAASRLQGTTRGVKAKVPRTLPERAVRGRARCRDKWHRAHGLARATNGCTGFRVIVAGNYSRGGGTDTIMISLGLIGDIGATNARFALVERGKRISAPRVLPTDEYAGIGEAIAAFLADERPASPPARAVLAVASPATGDQVTFTNNPWSFSRADLQHRLGLERLVIVNDFVACALAIPRLAEHDRRQVGGGTRVAGAPIGVLGPGTGLGVSALIPLAGTYVPVESEGGHVTLAGENAREDAVLAVLRRRFDHVSAERILSGPGLVNLYNALCELSGTRAAALSAAQITDPRIAEEDANAREAKATFCAMLGGVAGNLALTLGARGGVYIAGGIVPKLGGYLAQSAFRARFQAKGRLGAYLAAIPTYIVVHPWPALIGASHLLEGPPTPMTAIP
jgi:glucokinase